METLKRTEIKKQKCPCCNISVDSLSDIEENQPKPNDIAICINCYNLQVIANDLTLRQITSQELFKLQKNRKTWHKILAYRNALKATQRARHLKTKPGNQQ